MYLVNVREVFGYTHEQTLDSSFVMIEGMLQEYAYMCMGRNKSVNDQSGNDENGEFEWIDFIDFDTRLPKKVKRYKMV